MRRKIAFLFPGQGSQYLGMGKDLAASFAIAKETFQEAEDVLSYSLSRIMFEGPLELLTQTQHSQPAIFVHSVALLRILQKELPELLPVAVAGLSLGEYTALFASKRLGFTETLRLIQARAEAMHLACQKKVGTMAAVLGLSTEEVLSVIDPLSQQKAAWIANYNAPGQIVISGTETGVQAAIACFKEKTSARIIPLQVHGAFHSGLMQSAEETLAPLIRHTLLMPSEIGWVMNVPGDFVEEADLIRSYLVAQVTQSVRWEQGIRALMQRGIESYFEIGPGKTLLGLNRKIGAGFTESFDKVVDLEKVAKYALS